MRELLLSISFAVMLTPVSRGDESVSVNLKYGDTLVIREQRGDEQRVYVLNASCHPIACLTRGAVSVARVESIDELNKLVDVEIESGGEKTDQPAISEITKSSPVEVFKDVSVNGLTLNWTGRGPRDYSLFVIKPTGSKFTFALLNPMVRFPKLQEKDLKQAKVLTKGEVRQLYFP